MVFEFEYIKEDNTYLFHYFKRQNPIGNRWLEISFHLCSAASMNMQDKLVKVDGKTRCLCLGRCVLSYFSL